MSHDHNICVQQLQFVFGTDNPRLTRFPHCLFKNDLYPAGIISDTLQEPIGIWGDRCLIAPDGSPYLEPEDGRVVEEFWYWTLAENQDYARRFEGRWPPFSMAIPATTTVELLSRTYDLQDDEVGEFDYYNYIERISDVIDELKWAYIPVYGNDYAIFVAGSHRESIIGAVSANLSKAGIKSIFSVTQDTATQHWNGPQVWSDN